MLPTPFCYETCDLSGLVNFLNGLVFLGVERPPRLVIVCPINKLLSSVKVLLN